MLSAQLDSEDDPADRPLVDEHLAGCAACRTWLDRAAMVNRLTRTGAVADMPDLSAAVLAALPADTGRGTRPSSGGADGRLRRFGAMVARIPLGAMVARIPLGAVTRWRYALRRPSRAQLAAALYVALAVVGTAQLVLGLTQIGTGGGGGQIHDGMDAARGHLWHESAAWNVAVGAGYLFLALRRGRPSALVPTLTVFVGTLVLLSLNDLTAHRVNGTRLISHGFLVMGYLLVVALARVAPDSARPPGRRIAAPWRASFPEPVADDDTSAVPKLRLVSRRRGPLSARRDGRRAA
ncbi:membrane protein [Mangrovihabitans endophyticus]|uniref:Membrane protein n=2 Tax=Mangrovihabitans endophyticus TaxID=1751298 RepID=A0A8J3C1K6_9ACTN|nr:membrane protein [Mangrovihabitans endophyticus]